MGCIRKKKVQGLQLTNMYKKNLLLKSNLRMLNEDLDLAKSNGVKESVWDVFHKGTSSKYLQEYAFIKNDTNKSN
jgi:hypothetical protein